jgi:hypothetical protein
MYSTCRCSVGVALATAALLVGAGGPAVANPSSPSAAVPQAFSTRPDHLVLAVASGIVPGDRHTGYPSVACTPANDGEEVTTLLTVLAPVPIATFMNWVCDGATRTWKRR